MKALLNNSVNYSLNRKLAIEFGIPAAMVLNRLIWSINYHIENESEGYFRDEKWWTRDTALSLTYHFAGLWNVKTTERALKKLKVAEILVTKRLNSQNFDNTNFYSIDKIALDKILNSGTEITTKSVVSVSDKMSETVSDKMSESSLVNNQSNNHIKKYIKKDPENTKPDFKAESDTRHLNPDTTLGLLSGMPKPPKKKIKALVYYSPDNPFRAIYDVFVKYKAGQTLFLKKGEPDVNKYLTELGAEFDRTVPELINLANAFHGHYELQPKTVTSIKGRFRTWVSNDAKWNPKPKKKKPFSEQTPRELYGSAWRKVLAEENSEEF